MLSTQKTLKDLIVDAHIVVTAERTDHNPNMADSREMDHWKVVLKRMDRARTASGRAKTLARMSLYFSMGYGHHGAEPSLDDVLDCLLSDASANDQDFADWCSDLGFDEDSRKAERIYKACLKSGEKIRAFLGSDLFERMRYAER